MFDISQLSTCYDVRSLDDSDADTILDLCLQNAQYYRYRGEQPSKELIAGDLHVAPPNIPMSSKYYVGFFDNGSLVAVMDLIDGYPNSDCAFIGFFMMSKGLQGRGIGSAIIRDVCQHVRETGIKTVRLGIDKGNPQSTRFWEKSGFVVIDEVERDGRTLLFAEKTL